MSALVVMEPQRGGKTNRKEKEKRKGVKSAFDLLEVSSQHHPLPFATFFSVLPHLYPYTALLTVL
jgi:hypothetical protein